MTTPNNLSLYDIAQEGRIFTGNIAAAGVVLPIYSNTTQQCGLWNPVGTNVDVVLIKLALTLVDTTGAATGFVLGYLSNAPAAVGTGLAITAFTETTPVSNYPGGGYAAKAKFGQGATLTVTGPGIKRHLGLNQLVLTPATTGAMQWSAEWRFEGDEVLTPGTAIFLAGNIAQLAKWTGSIVWAEIPR